MVTLKIIKEDYKYAVCLRVMELATLYKMIEDNEDWQTCDELPIEIRSELLQEAIEDIAVKLIQGY